MKKRILSFLLALVMIVGVFPTPVYAEDSSDATMPPAETPEQISCPTCGTEGCNSEHLNWCADCKVDDCGVDHTAKVCKTCEKEGCSSEHLNWCADCKVDDCGLSHVFCQICQKNDCGTEHNAADPALTDNSNSTSPFHANIGRMAKFDTYYSQFPIVSNPAGITANNVFGADIAISKDVIPADLIVKIVDCYVNTTEDIYWYKVEAAEGHALPALFPSPAWVFQDNVSVSYGSSLIIIEEAPENNCPICGESNCTKEHIQCSICGKYDCLDIHFFCEICGVHSCGKAHVYCLACGELACERAHKWCGSCGKYDCGITHEKNPPHTAPVIPENPMFTAGAEVSIVDEHGNAVTEEGFVLFNGTKLSLSAWSVLGELASYQWQVCYDSENNLWVDIQGQTGKGILVSPAMFLSLIGGYGTAYIRCVASTETETKTSAAIPVTLAEQSVAMGMSSSSSVSLAATEDVGELSKAYVVVQYVYSDGRIAAGTEIAEIIPGNAYSFTHQLAVIPGYKAALNTHSHGDSAKIVGGNLVMNFAEGVLTDEYTLFTVTYEPDFVSYTVIHYWQNVDNDNYTEHERQTISTTHKTGDVITDAHKSYPGFYNLLYVTPAAAADGSTVIEVYYDRFYYLMKFELDGGYGVYPIYARYDDVVEIDTPKRAGYEFGGWTDENGQDITIPGKVPVGGGTYYAKWLAHNTKYAVAYWIEHDDGTKTYIGSEIMGAESGSTVSGSDTLSGNTYVCGRLEHSHDASCEKICTLPDHTHGDGSCQYICGKQFHDHSSGCDCTTTAHSTHTRTCYRFTAEVSGSGNNANNLGNLKSEGNNNGFEIYSRTTSSGWFGSTTYYYVKISGTYYQITNYDRNTPLEYTLTCHYHTSACCSIEEHIHSAGCCSVHAHDEKCYSCGSVEHSHTDDCKTALYKYVQFKRADQNVTVDGDGSSIVNVYYEYKTYTIRFIYARKNGNGYQIAGLTRDGTLGNCWWTNGGSALPTFTDPSGKTERSIVTIGSYSYYYISLTAKYGENISAIWPSANIGNAGSYEWGSWAAAAGTGYRKKYGDAHANIVGPYPTMSSDMIVDNPEKLADGTYLAQNMIAWWGSNQGIENHAYHNYFELLPNEDAAGSTVVEYNGKRYKLVETYTFTAAHNGDTRVDPIFFNGFQCINDTRDTNDDKQANSNNYKNNGNCSICGTDCKYCNTFYYDRNIHKVYFWNHNGYLQDGTGSSMPYGASLAQHSNYVTEDFMRQPENYPDGLEPNAYEFAGWYTSSDCLDGTEMNWNTTMPDSDLTVYAKWIPVSRKVNFFLTLDSLYRSEIIPSEMDRLVQQAVNAGMERPASDPYSTLFEEIVLPHGSYLGKIASPMVMEGYENIHPQAGYDFIGWFYMDEDGNEAAFDPSNMPVHQDLNLYAKWSSNVLCYYNVFFALDVKNNDTGAEGPDGKADMDANGNIIYVADSISGSAIAGHTYTFTAKGGENLYTDYREGYFPTVGSHSIVIDITDEAGTGSNSFTFLYRPKAAVPYTVKYVDKATGVELFETKYVSGNKNVVVTENFLYKQGYMPDAYQKTLVVTDDNDESNDVITFYYTKDEEHALYVVNYYIQELDSDLKHLGWSKYNSLQNTGTIGTNYTADAVVIGGFTLSPSYTDEYNVTQNKNGMEGTTLPSTVGSLSGQRLTGKLSNQGMELNFYYTRNLYPYEFRYMLNGTSTELAEPEVGKAAYDSVVTEAAEEITKDLDGDGIPEDYRLYNPIENTKDIHIIVDGEALSADSVVTKGQALVNVATFYYVRCTQNMSITKTVVDNSAELDPNPDQIFTFSLLIHSKNGYHQSSYAYTKSDGTQGVLYPEITAPNTLQFSLKAGQTITIADLPTAEYTVSEFNLPTGYYDISGTNERKRLTVDGQLDVTVTNSFEPANLTIRKSVNVVELETNVPEVTDFYFTVTVPGNVSGTFAYKVEPVIYDEPMNREATVFDGKIVISLRNGQAATFSNLPVGSYHVTEAAYEDKGYNDLYSVNGAEAVDADSATINLTRGTSQSVECLNHFPVGDLIIKKTVTKEFYGTEWSGDTFTFTLERTTPGRPLISNNQYKVLVDGVEQNATVVVDANGKLTVEITFDGTDAEMMDEQTEANASASHILTIKNLPSGTYKVAETANEAYIQTPVDLTASVLIPSESNEAEFVNHLKRPTGSLSLTKILEAANGFKPDGLPKGTKFSFTIELTEQPPVDTQSFAAVYNKPAFTDGTATPTAVAMVNGAFTVEVEADHTITINDLPIGKYRITEATVPQFANNFAHIVNGVEEVQTTKISDDGNLYTEINVKDNETAQVKCTNVYPVDRAELIIQKLVTKEYDRDTLPNQTFTFTVTLSEEDTGINSYSYKVYNFDGTEDTDASGEATVLDRMFTVPLKAGQYAVISDMPVCDYTVSENVDSTDYNTSYEVYISEAGESASTQVNTTGAVAAYGTDASVSRTFSAGKTDAIVFTNEYTRHLGTLTINKIVSGTTEQDLFIFHIKGSDASNSHIDMDVTISGSGSVKICDLPLGAYTVTEDTEWSWRYDQSDSDTGDNTITLDDLDAVVTFENQHVTDKWLNFATSMLNVFGKKENE